MRVVLLGTGTAIPVKERGYAGIYARIGKEHLLLDAGPGTLKQLARLGVTFLDLHRLFLTHFHPDHCLDLVSILFAMRIPPPAPQFRGRAGQPARTKPLTIYGPRGLKQLYRQLNTAFHGWVAPRTYRLSVQEIGETTLNLPGYTVRTKRMNHADGKALGYRLEAGGKSVVYSGDTDVCQEIVQLGRRADVLILECSMTDERKVAGHLTPSECGRIASETRCQHLVLTHFYPIVTPAKARQGVRTWYRGPLILGTDLKQLDYLK